MKKVLFKQENDKKNRVKNISVLTKNEDKDSKTEVFKSFMYKVSVANEIPAHQAAPQVFIRKALDTVNGIEKFNFRVKGAFYLTHNRRFIKVRFVHTLNILINWKKNFSPKKSEVLTKKA